MESPSGEFDPLPAPPLRPGPPDVALGHTGKETHNEDVNS